MNTAKVLTREEIQALPAGREMDVLVAAVLGDRKEDGWWLSADGSKWSAAHGGPREYSTNIAAAWVVVEKIRGECPRDRGNVCDHFALDAPEVGAWPDPAAAWAAGWHDYAGRERVASVVATADAAPLAICRACLLALTPEAP